MKTNKFLTISSIALLSTMFVPGRINAHCPLCTVTVGGAAAIAAALGVELGAIGVFVGGFTVALSLWLAKKIKKKFENQSLVLFWVLYISTMIPFYFMFRGDYVSRYIDISGEYGSMLNKTYVIDLFIVGSVLGSLLVYLSPKLSSIVTTKRGGKQMKFQGVIINFLLLIVGGLIMQIWSI